MIELSAADIAAITGGELIGGAAQASGTIVNSATTDSRGASPGSLFIAKPGEHSDGHLFVDAAFERGAVLALDRKSVV